MMKINKELADKIKIFLYSPITALIFSVLLGLFFYFMSISHKSPSYFNTPSELVAKKSDSNLKFLYRDKEVSNVFYTTLVIWNDGDDYIDFSDFIESKPLRFYSKDSIQILSVSLDKKSRKDLLFQSLIDKNSVVIKLSEDEALEEGDGASFNILYTKVTSRDIPIFNLESRIKGTKHGFLFKDVTNFKKTDHKQSVYILWFIIVALLIIRIITLYLFKKEIIFRNKELVFMGALLFITVYLTIQQIFYTTNLDWLQ